MSLATTGAGRSKGQNAAIPWWMAAGVTPWAAYAPKGAASFAASLVDLTGQGHDAADPGGLATPGWDAVNGWTFDGLAQYLTTTFLPQNDQSQSAFVQFTNGLGTTRCIFGHGAGADKEFLLFRQISTGVRYANGGLVNVGGNIAAGNLGIAGNRGYRNGVAEGAAIGAWEGAVPGTGLTIGAYAGFLYFDQVNIQSFIIYSVALDEPQAALIAAAMAAL